MLCCLHKRFSLVGLVAVLLLSADYQFFNANGAFRASLDAEFLLLA